MLINGGCESALDYSLVDNMFLRCFISSVSVQCQFKNELIRIPELGQNKLISSHPVMKS